MESEKVKEIKLTLQGLIKQDVYINKFVTPNDILTYINELESENERWKKDCADIANDYQEMGKFYLEETEKNQQLKDRIAELEKRCHFIWALGYDYDGCEKAESLKSLIDELVGIAQGNWGDVCSKCENKQDNLINYKLKQFTKMLKEKGKLKLKQLGMQFVDFEDIDETLKEFIKEN